MYNVCLLSLSLLPRDEHARGELSKGDAFHDDDSTTSLEYNRGLTEENGMHISPRPEDEFGSFGVADCLQMLNTRRVDCKTSRWCADNQTDFSFQ